MSEAPAPTAAPATPQGVDAWDLTTDWLGRHGALPALGALMILMAAVYGGVFRGEISGDDLSFHLAESSRIADCLRAGDLDLWNTSANAGYASAYYYQVIPQLASAIPAAIFGHMLFWFQLSVFLPLVLAPAASYRGLRHLGATSWQAFAGAGCVSLCVGASRWGHGADGTFSVGLYTQTWALAAFPLALGNGVRWIRDREGLGPAVAWGAFVGLCHPFAGISLGLALGAGVVVWIMGWSLGLVLGAGLLAWIVGGATTSRVGRVGAGFMRLLAAVGARVRDAITRLTQAEPALAVATDPPAAPFRLAVLGRLVVLGALLLVASLPGWITVIVDYAGFGGFPHRVADEIGPGFAGLLHWHTSGMIFDSGRPAVLTWAAPIVLMFARGRFLRWLWAPALVYAVLLGLGPHLKTADDLLPAVRFLGTLQIVVSLAIGAGAVALGDRLRRAGEDLGIEPLAVRTLFATIAAVLAVLLLFGVRMEVGRVHVAGDWPNIRRGELMELIEAMRAAPPGRKQAGPGAENHWWNLLPYVYARRDALLQMGGGGLQASPNYDAVWTERDAVKDAYVFDAPLVLLDKARASEIVSGEVIASTEHYQLRLLNSPGLVSPVEVTGELPDGRVAAHTAALAWLKTPQPMKDRVLAYVGSRAGLSTPPAGHVVSYRRQLSPGDEPDIVAEVEATAPTTFMVRESWHPRWRAFVDGAEVPVRRVTPDFPALDVPAGHHTISLRFDRPWWALAAWLAWPGAALLGWLVTRRRRSPSA
jgi:hypothetical protein